MSMNLLYYFSLLLHLITSTVSLSSTYLQSIPHQAFPSVSALSETTGAISPIKVVVPRTDESQICLIASLFDSKGDGWNGAFLNITKVGETKPYVSTSQVENYPAKTVAQKKIVCMDCACYFAVAVGGTNDDEISYDFHNDLDNVIAGGVGGEEIEFCVKCQSCEIGMEPNLNDDGCELCETGKYSHDLDSSPCQVCPWDTM